MAQQRPPQLQVDLKALRALAHPLRVRMLELLDQEGGATASGLAQLLEETSGTTSYHLRQLAKHGFIEEDPDRGNWRERWWRVYPGGVSIEGWRFLEDPSSARDVLLVARELARTYVIELDRWFSESSEWGAEWIQASTNSTRRFVGTRAELAALRDEVLEVIDRHESRAQGRDGEPDTARIVVHFHAFPSATRGSADEQR